MKPVTSLFVWLCLGSLFLPAIESDKPDFSGTWVLDRAASQIAPTPDRETINPQPDITLVIAVAGSTLLCERHALALGKEHVHKFDIFTDGRASTIIDHIGKEHQATFAWRENRLVGHYVAAIKWRGDREITIQIEQIQYLAPDERTMTIEVHRTLPKRDIVDIMVFKKKDA
jgi:hypothetical protein